MRKVLLVAVAALALPLTAGAESRIASVDTRDYPSVRVTVVTPSEDRAPAVTENGRPVVPLRTENLGRGKSLVLAIDRSQSMEGAAFDSAVAAARAFVGRKSARDRVAVFGFGSRAVRLTRFSSATIDTDLALRGLAVDDRQGTALYDAVVGASQALATEARQSRVLVVLTDGADVSSEAKLADAIVSAKKANVIVHAIGLESEQFSPAPLRRLAGATGGSYRAATSPGALAAVYAAVGAQLRRTWQVEYLTTARRAERVTVGSAGAEHVFTVPGTPAPPPPGPSGLVPGPAYSGLGAFMFGGAAGVLLLLALAAAGGARRGSRLRNRLAPHVDELSRQRRRGRARFGAAATVMAATEKAFGTLALWKRVHKLLERSDVPLRTVEFLYVALGSSFFFGLLGALFSGRPFVVLLMFAFGAAVPFGVLWYKARRRLKAFEDQLPDVLLTIAASLKAGHSFKQGLQTVADEGSPPASMEFQRALGEIRLGRPVEEALRDMAERVASENLDFVITAVSIQSQVGGSLASLFDMVADAVRQRQQFARKIKGLTAMGRASAYVLIGMPFFLAGAITLLNAEYMEPLFTTSAGRTMIMVGLVMIALGSAVLKKIVSFRG